MNKSWLRTIQTKKKTSDEEKKERDKKFNNSIKLNLAFPKAKKSYPKISGK
jgi:hypothetical protein